MKKLLLSMVFVPGALFAMQAPQQPQAQPHKRAYITDPYALANRASKHGFGNVIWFEQAQEIINKRLRKERLASLGLSGIMSCFEVYVRARQVGLNDVTEDEAWAIVCKALMSLPVAEGLCIEKAHDLLKHCVNHGFSIKSLDTAQEIIDEHLRQQLMARVGFAGLLTPVAVSNHARAHDIKLKGTEAWDIADEELLYFLSSKND